jgi:hypothetical protein
MLLKSYHWLHERTGAIVCSQALEQQAAFGVTHATVTTFLSNRRGRIDHLCHGGSDE